MPVGANKPGKHGGSGGTKPSKDKSDEKRGDAKEPDSPAKLKSPTSSKPASIDAKQKSQQGKTADEHLAELRAKVKQAGGPDVKAVGWTCKLVHSAKVEGSASGGPVPLDPCWVEPETGKEFLKRKNVLKHLGLSEPKKVTREEAAIASRESFKELNKESPLPQKIGHVTVLQWGKVAYDRSSFHSRNYIWPIGFKSRWIDENEQGVTYESEVRDGKEKCGAPDDLNDVDAPVFVVCVTRPGEDKPTEFFGKNGKQVWRRATKDDKAKDHTGLRDEEVCKRLEGLKNADKCQNYEFIATRPPPVELEDDFKSPKKKKAKSSGGDSGAKTKIAGKKRKAEGPPKKESQKAKRAREREEKLQEKAKEKEEKERKQQAAAEEKRLAKEEEARKRKEAKELQEIEQKWLSRYPIEDLAIHFEEEAMEAAKSAGHDVPAQRAAARAVVEAVERGWGEAAVLAAGKEAAESRAAGDSEEEAIEKGLFKGEEVLETNPAAHSMVVMDVDDDSCVDGELLWRVGTRVKVLFKIGDTDQKFLGFVSKFSDDSKRAMIDFYDETEALEYSIDDPDVEILGQGLLRLPPLVPKPERAPVHSADLLTVARFVDAFRAELKLPKGTIKDLQDGLEDPANSDFLAQLYQALLISAMEATKEANPNAVIPAAWQGDNTLTNHTWPEIARRWITCGPHAELKKHRFPEAVLAATCLSSSPGGSKSRPEGHLKLLISLMEDSMDHPDIHSAVEKRIEVGEEAKKTRDERIKQSDIDLKDARERIREAEAAVAKVDVGEDGADAEPVPDEATSKAIEAAKAILAESAEAGIDATVAMDAGEADEAKALRIAFEEQYADWKKRRDERGGKAADKELAAALRDEKKLLDQRVKTEVDCVSKLEKFTTRQAPLGMDRHRNKYWWFASDASTLYVETPMPPSGQDQPDSSSFSFEWRMWCGAEAMTKVSDCLCEKGVRESELKAGILKIVEKMDAEQVQSTVRPHLKLQESTDQLKFYESFQIAHQEAKNIYEVFNPEQQKFLAREFPSWEKYMENLLDCDQMAQLLLNLEHAVHESLAHTKRTKRDVSASRASADAAAPTVPTENGNPDTNGARVGDVPHDLPEEWQNDNIYIGKRVRRNVLGEDDTHAGKANGTIVGYLPKEKSDFKSKQTNQDAALWKLKFDDPDIGNGYEDLEEYEVKQAILDYEKMQASLQSAVSLRGGLVPTRSDGGEGGTAETSAGAQEIEYDEGAIDMAEASNKVTGALWTSTMQRDAWRHEVEHAAAANSVVRMCYSSSVLCENVLRVMGKTRNDLSSAPRRTRTERNKRSREVADLAVFSGFTESGRRVKKVNYAENNHDSDDSD